MARVVSGDGLSAWWKFWSAVTMAFGFAALILLTVRAYHDAPPIPASVVDDSGAVIFTGADVASGQEVFLRYGLMSNGSIWSHGAYLGPDFSAQYLHDWALDVATQAARDRFSRAYDSLSPEERA